MAYSPKVAFDRVARRVSKGGHNIPPDVIERRYYRGLINFFELYKPICDRWIVVNNMDELPQVVAESEDGVEKTIIDSDIWVKILFQYNDSKTK